MSEIPVEFTKQFKDPIYDYIEINSSLVSQIIDTPAFQRLKDIRQTSYTPLFPAAHHNRYVHSLGVYHLGRMAFQAIEPQLVEYSKGTNKPVPHECMSCIVGLRTYSVFFENVEQKSFFARCIIGMKIRLTERKPSEFKQNMSEGEKKELKKQRELYKIKKQEVELLNCVIDHWIQKCSSGL